MTSGQMTCVILVAGHNNALEEQMKAECVTGLGGVPKALLPVQGRDGKGECAVLDLWWSDLKERRQFSSVYLVTNADKYKYFERWATASDFPVENIVNDGTTTHKARNGGVTNLHMVLKTKNIMGDVMVVSGDMLINEDFDISGVKRFFDQLPGDLLIYYKLKPTESTTTRGMVEVSEKTKQITKFAEKPQSWHTDLASVVFYCFKAKTCRESLPAFIEKTASQGSSARGFGKLMEYMVPSGNVYGMKVPTSFDLVGPTTTLEEYLAVKKARIASPKSQQALSQRRATTKRAYARVGLLGNPSDGFYGKTIAMTIANFWADVSIMESERLKLTPHPINDPTEFGGLSDLYLISNKEGYVGGLRLMQATCKRFYEQCTSAGIALPKRNFTLSYDTNIPRQVGLAGSSCIVTACLKALMSFYGITDSDIPKCMQPSLVLSVETDELGIAAGLQDRVVQNYEGIVYMDFGKELMEANGHGSYEVMETEPPELFLMYAADPSDSGRIHSNVRDRWRAGDPEVVAAMSRFADIAELGKAAVLAKDWAALGNLMDDNFNLRRETYGDAALGRKNLDMVNLGREFGCHMKFPGSGGAVIGLLPPGGTLEPISLKAQEHGFVCVPIIPHTGTHEK